MDGNVEIELTGAGKDRKLVVRNNSDAVVTISADLAGLLAIPTAPAPDAPTAYCATCGHDHPVDERDYPDEPATGATDAELAEFAKEWRRRADQLDSTGNSWAASASGVYRYCANEIDPTHHREFPTTPTLPNDEPSYTMEDVVAMVDHLPSLLKMRAGITKDEIRAFVKNFKNK